MKKRVLLLAVSCKNGGLCPGGIDLDNMSQWIRIVNDDEDSGPVQGCDIDYANPLDIIEFDGRPMPQGKQKENWVIDNESCVNKGRAKLNGSTTEASILKFVYEKYSYHGFWGNSRSFLTEDEFEDISDPTESILKVKNVRIYKNDYGRAKIDFEWSNLKYPIKGISMTDPDFYEQIDDEDVEINEAYIVISIPKACDWRNPNTGQFQAYKFVSKVFANKHDYGATRRAYPGSTWIVEKTIQF